MFPRPKRKLRSLNPDSGPWLIWSHYHYAWHRQNEQGGASGYTTDLAQAGLFSFETAKAYHDLFAKPKQLRDQAIPIAKMIRNMDHRLAEMDTERNAFAAKINAFRERAHG